MQQCKDRGAEDCPGSVEPEEVHGPSASNPPFWIPYRIIAKQRMIGSLWVRMQAQGSTTMVSLMEASMQAKIKRKRSPCFQGCHSDGQTDTSITSNKALVHPLRNIRAYLSIFKHILENIQRSYQLRPIVNGQNRPFVCLSRPYTTCLLPRLSSMTTFPASGAR
jgi:hypothetical protein